MDKSHLFASKRVDALVHPLELPQVTFLTELGDLPLLSTSLDFEVEPTIDGTKENFECGGQGICGEHAQQYSRGGSSPIARALVLL